MKIRALLIGLLTVSLLSVGCEEESTDDSLYAPKLTAKTSKSNRKLLVVEKRIERLWGITQYSNPEVFELLVARFGGNETEYSRLEKDWYFNKGKLTQALVIVTATSVPDIDCYGETATMASFGDNKYFMFVVPELAPELSEFRILAPDYSVVEYFGVEVGGVKIFD